MQATFHALPAAAPPVDDRRAGRVLFAAIGLGVVTQALFWNARLGLDWLVWDLIMIGVTLAVLGRRPLGATAIGASAACALFGLAIVMHHSAFTTWVALPANLAALAALPVIVGEDVGFADLGTVPLRLLRTVGLVPSAIGRTVTLPVDAISVLDEGGRAVAKRSLAGLLVGVPVAGVFAVLLSADAGFAALLGRVEARVGTAASFAVYALITAVVYAFAHALFAKQRAPDASTIAPADAPYRQLDAAGPSPLVSPLTWGLIVGQVAAVFFVYVLVRRDTEFGGHDVIRGRGDLTYAGHLHAGFYQLLLATLLSVGLVVFGHRLLRARDEDTTVPGGARLAAIEGALLVLTGLTLVSCAQRLRIYEEAYGATHLRVGVALVILIALAVLSCTLAKAVFRGFRAFGGATTAAVAACALGASFFDADGYVTRTNLDRVARGKALDFTYLAQLSADACAHADHPVLKEQPYVRKHLILSWAENQRRSRDVRELRGLVRCPSVTP
ncbi:MAG: DUF4173 domain-containing protein [Deltaproteobacteria bacterium]|nr:DUF4173 domain-containing protein [Deltaproteobacteria bacterium]